MKKRFALPACACLLALLSGCSPSPEAITVDGRDVDAAELAFYMEYNRLNLENRTGTAQADGTYDEQTTQQVKEESLDQIVTAEVVLIQQDSYQVTENRIYTEQDTFQLGESAAVRIDTDGLELTDADEKALKENKDALIEEHGGTAGYLEFLQASAMTDRVYDKFQANVYYYDKLYNYLVGDEGEYAYSDEELRQFFADHYAQVQYIRFSLLDDQGEPLSDSEAAAQLEEAQRVLRLAQTPGCNFTALLGQYNDDTYMSANADGIVISHSQISGSPQFDELLSLENNEVGGVYEGADGYYIVKRLPLTAAYYDNNREAIQQEARDAKFNELLDGWKEDATVHTSKVYAKMDLENLWDYVK